MKCLLFCLAILAVAVRPAWGQHVNQPPALVDTAWRATAATAIPITRRVDGDPSETGPFRYFYKAPAGASLSSHRHSVDMRSRSLAVASSS
jgi:hypothetical protein